MRPLAAVLSEAQVSATGAMEEEARRLSRAGRRVLSFAEGEPDIVTPSGIRSAAAAALNAGVTRYTDPTGTSELREAIADDLIRRGVGHYAPDEIVVTAGAKAAVYNALTVLCDPGDEVIIPSPYWVSFPEQVRLLGARPVLVPCANKFLPDVDAIARAITPRTKALILNTPNNPTGAVYPSDLVTRLVRLVAASGVYTVLDVVYERFVYDAPPSTSAPEPRDAVVVVNSFSKSYAMTGWRLGYAAGPRAVIGAMGVLQSHSAGNPSAVAQAAGLWALAHSTDYVAMREAYRRRRDLITRGLRSLPGVHCDVPDGAFYVLAEVQGVYSMVPASYGRNAAGVAAWWLREAGVATVPGEPFGCPGYVRFCYTPPEDQIVEALQRLAELLTGRVSEAGRARGA